MQKNQLIKLAAKRSGMTQEATARAVNSFLEVVSISIAAGEPVGIAGFGEFTQLERPAMKSSLNGSSRTREAKIVPRRRGVGFRASPILKNRMNKGLKANG